MDRLVAALGGDIDNPKCDGQVIRANKAGVERFQGRHKTLLSKSVMRTHGDKDLQKCNFLISCKECHLALLPQKHFQGNTKRACLWQRHLQERDGCKK